MNMRLAAVLALVFSAISSQPALADYTDQRIKRFEDAVERAEKTQAALDRAMNDDNQGLDDAFWKLVKERDDAEITPNTVREIFGTPTRSEDTTCGQNSPGGHWKCKALTYSSHRSGIEGLFLFQRIRDKWVLNGYSIER